MRVAPWLIPAVFLAGCAGAQPQRPPEQPPVVTSGPATSDALPASALVYLRAWGANDMATMVRNSEPRSPARGFAEYWQDVYEAGRLDSGQADVAVVGDRATLTYADGTTYSVGDVRVSGEGLVTWTASPGGPLAPRVVAGQPVGSRAGGVVTEALRQYVNSDGDLRVSLRVRNGAGARRDLFARGYRGAGGSATATMGSGTQTGVVQVSADSTIIALVSVERARPGGRLTLAVVDSAGSEEGRIVLRLPG